MKFGSVCSGIEAASVAWHGLGWEASFLSEIEAFPRAVLSHHYPAVPLHGDFTTIQKDDYAAIDVLVGGTPCQSFSVAGLRAGLRDPRGNLMLEFGALARRLEPRWLVWENVPGVLSSAGGRDFGTFLGMLAELGYGFAYRVLDAQFFGVAQRRRRVFVVGYLGDWRPAAAVLFERASLRGDSAPSRDTGKAVAPTIRSCAPNGSPSHGQWSGDSRDELIVPITMAHGQGGAEIGFDRAPTLSCNHEAPIAAVAFHPTQDPISSTDGSTHAMGTGSGNGCATVAVAAEYYSHDYCHDRVYSVDGISPALNCSQEHAIRAAMQVRRLTPVECERLQGFPDNYSRIPWRGKPADHCPDGPRYKALGNSMAVPVMRWIGERIQRVEDLL